MKTKTQIAIAVALGVLFVAVPSATLKAAKPAGLAWGVACNDIIDIDGGETDSCTVTITGLNSSATYRLEVTDGCGGFASSNANAPQLASPGVVVALPDCTTGTTFSLFTVGKRGQQLVSTYGPVLS
jgi:hypothetical protein